MTLFRAPANIHVLVRQAAHKTYCALWQQEHLDRFREANRSSKARFKHIVLSHYSGSNGKPRCVRCGFEDIRALTIDHIAGNGAQEKREKGTGEKFYYYLRKHGFPEGYQTLCANCQFIKRVENKEWGTGVKRVENKEYNNV